MKTNRLAFIAVKAFHLFSFQLFHGILQLIFTKETRRLGVQMFAIFGAMLRLAALWAAVVAETANDCLAEDAAADAANYMLEHKAPSKWTRRTCRWNRDLADLYWFMVEQLVIKLIQPLKVNVHAVSKLSSTLVIFLFFSTRFPPCWLMFYAVGWLCGQGTLSLSQHGQQADRREQLATLSILLSNHANVQLGVASMNAMDSVWTCLKLWN